jgi:hypothetical protein
MAMFVKKDEENKISYSHLFVNDQSKVIKMKKFK